MAADPKAYLRIQFFHRLIGAHREWLKGFDPCYLRAWDQLFTEDNSEAAICEAGTRQLLQELDVTVEPYPPGAIRTPDFKCHKGTALFYVDATCVMKDTATRRTGLPDVSSEQKAYFYSLLTEAYSRKVGSKESQFGNLAAPRLIAIGTLHFQGGALCFDKKSAEEVLTGKSGVGMNIDKRTGAAVGDPYLTTSLESAVFLNTRKIICNEPLVRPIRQAISAILLCPLGTQPSKCFGILHPMPHYAFDRDLLRHINFCRLKPGWEDGRLITEWI